MKNLAWVGSRKAFSLVELLVVIAIMVSVAALAAFSLAELKNFSTSQGVSQAASEVRGLLEFARNEAVTRQTYVWAAFRETTLAGTPEIQMVVVGSMDGTTSAMGTNLTALSRVVRVRHVGLTNWKDLNPETQALLPSATIPVDLISNTAGITYNLPQAQFVNTTITFTPRGEALLAGSPTSTDGFTPLIAIGIVPSRGDQKDTTMKNDAVVVIDGSIGTARVLRK